MGLTRVNNQALTNVTSAGLPTITNDKLPTLDSDKLPSGTVLQTVHVSTDGTSSVTSSSSGNQLTALNTLITPKSTSSKLLITVSICGEFSHTGAAYNSMFSISRTIGGSHTELTASGSANRMHGIMPSAISYQKDAGSTLESAYFQYVDTPNTTSQITYAPRVKGETSNTFYLNRTVADNNTSAFERGVSSVVIQEIVG